MKVKSDHRSRFSNLSNWKEETWKISGLQQDSNLWPPRYWLLSSYLPVQWNDVKYIWNSYFVLRLLMKVKSDHRNKFSNQSNWKEEARKIWGPQRNPNLRPPRHPWVLVSIGIAEVTGSNPIEAPRYLSGLLPPAAQTGKPTAMITLHFQINLWQTTEQGYIMLDRNQT